MQLEYIVAGSAVYATVDGAAIDCIAKFDAIPEELPFTASATDPLPHAVEVWEALMAGDAGEIAPYVAPPVRVPPTIARHQGLLALLGAGITETMIRDALATIEDATERERTRIRFESSTWHRGSEFIAWGQAVFELTDEQTDDLFREAAAQ